ncbi:hypothetical protein L6R46_01410 [Myxococcota bacterium]|nr:hypothetical protein [Myxococcota bacterium]
MPPRNPRRQALTALSAWFGVNIVLAALFVGLNLAYRAGADAVEFKGGVASFDREFDGALFGIDAKRAYRVSGSGDVAVVKIKPGTPPFRPVCGTTTLDGSLINLAMYQRGDWVYSGYPEFDGVDAYNVRTGEALSVSAPTPAPGSTTDPMNVPEYRSRGLTFTEANKLTLERIVRGHRQLASIEESCEVFNAAFFVLFAASAVVGLWLAARALRSSAAPTAPSA